MKQETIQKKAIRFRSFSYESFSITLIWTGVIIMIIFFVFLAADAFVFQWMSIEQDSRLGNLGQILEGTVGSVWALAGVILVYEALRFQRLELKAQRQEFELNRQEVMEQTLQLRLQNITLQSQAFESTYFQLLSLHNEIVSSIQIDGASLGKHLKGRKCFHEYFTIFIDIYNNNIDLIGLGSPDTSEFHDLINET